MLIYAIVFIILVVIVSKLNSPQYKGKYGENVISQALKEIEGYNYVVNNIMLNDNGKSRQIDHIFVSEYGVFVIETKNYGGTIYGKEKSTEWKQYLNKKCFNFKNPIHQNYGHEEIVKKVLKSVTDKIYSLVVFTRRCELKVEVTSTVIYDNQLKNYIRNKGKILDISKVNEIYKVLMENKIENEEAIRNHNYNVQKYVEYKESVANAGKCPRCNGDLIKRQGKNGSFYGCSSYPKCRYTKNI